MEDKKKALFNEAIQMVSDRKLRYKAIEILKPLADEGNCEAMYWLAECCRNSVDVPDNDQQGQYTLFQSNPEKALQLLQQSACLGFPRALYNLGMFYYDKNSKGVRDTEKAYQYFKSAAEQGYAPAEYMLAHHFSCLAVKLNDDEAIALYKKAAESGHAEAEYELAQLYRAGRDIDNNGATPENPDLEKAFYWLKRSAEHGLRDGQYAAAICLYFGRGTEKNEQEAIELLKKAADKGSTLASIKLAELGIKWANPFDRQLEEKGRRVPKKILSD